MEATTVLRITVAACCLVSTVIPVSVAAVEPELPRVRLSLQALDLTRPPSTHELMAAGQLGGALYPTHDALNKTKTDRVNLSFGHAIQAWNDHEWETAATLFRRHVEEYPDSPWVSEAVLHLGCEARYNGRYGEAEELLGRVVALNRGNEHAGAKMLLNKARQRLAVLKVLQNNFRGALELFAELKQESPDWRHRTYAAHWIQRLSRYKSDELAMLNCGAQALAHILRGEGREAEAREVLDVVPSSSSGHSLEDLASLASRYGYDLTGLTLSVPELRETPLPAILQLDGTGAGDRGHYWVLENVSGRSLTLFDPQSRRRFFQTFDEFGNEWSGNALVFSSGEELPGSRLTPSEMAEIYGGCCGAPRSESDLGDPGVGDDCGAPAWKVNPINMNLYVRDTPMWYRPPIGPPVEITLSYNSQSSIAHYEPFGNKWQFNYASYLIVDPGSSVKVFMPDGSRDDYVPQGSVFYPPYKVFNELVRIGADRYELRFPDGSVYAYDMPKVLAQISYCYLWGWCTPPVDMTQHFLVEIRDAYGQSVDFTYDASGQLVTIEDAIGNAWTLTYNVDGHVTQVSDPFARTAIFEYDLDGNLTGITDMGGYRAGFAYDADVYLTSIDKSGLVWSFYIEPADGIVANFDTYPPPGDSMWENYRITVTDPTGAKEEYFYYGGCDPDMDNICSGYSWYVSPRDYLEWRGPDANNYASRAPKTRYLPVVTGPQGAEIARILTPEGRDTFLEYDVNGNLSRVTDSHGHALDLTSNHKGRFTSLTDPRDAVTNVLYAPNGVDAVEVQDGLGSIGLTYNGAHDVTSMTDRLLNTTSATYNGFGQLNSITDPLGDVRTFEYDANHHLVNTRRNGAVTTSLTYDALGRTATRTDATGLQIVVTYDDLDRITRVTYPDSRFIEFEYSSCCVRQLSRMTDRAGRESLFSYDELGRLTAVRNSEAGVERFSYDRNGNMTRLIDPRGNATSYLYDLDNRLIRKTYADDTFESFLYDVQGLPIQRQDARGTITAYAYDTGHGLLNLTYSDGTAPVTFQYDQQGRVTQRQDGVGIYQFSYDAQSRLGSIDGPWTADTVTALYDGLGRVTNIDVLGGQSTLYGYDGLGRLQTVQDGSGTFTYSYNGVNPLPQVLTHSNGATSTYQYNALNLLTSIVTEDSVPQVLGSRSFTYDTTDRRSSETVVDGLSSPTLSNELISYDYNELNQPTSLTFDAGGNMTQGYTPDGYLFTADYDAENRLVSVEYTDGSSVLRTTEFHHGGDGLLARIVERENGLVAGERRLVRAPGSLALQERDASNTTLARYTWGLDKGGGIGGLLGTRQGASDYTYLYDGKGNVSGLLDSAQSVVAAYRYDTFGLPVVTSGSLDQAFRFSTKRFHPATGLSYYGYRFYSAILGRWLNRDPLNERDDVNLYAYARNSPVDFSDPSGLQSGRVSSGAVSFQGAIITAKPGAWSIALPLDSIKIETLPTPSTGDCSVGDGGPDDPWFVERIFIDVVDSDGTKHMIIADVSETPEEWPTLAEDIAGAWRLFLNDAKAALNTAVEAWIGE